jgi:hypothetical protein
MANSVAVPGGDTARASPGFCWASPAGPAELGYLAQPAWRSWATAAGPLGLGAWGRWRLRGMWAQFLPSGCSFGFFLELFGDAAQEPQGSRRPHFDEGDRTGKKPGRLRWARREIGDARYIEKMRFHHGC